MTTPRFIHVRGHALYPFKKHYTDVTIAYRRTEDFVTFAYVLCHKNDKFVKSIGRELSTKLLDFTPIAVSYTHINERNQTGCIIREDTVGYADDQLSRILSDQLVSQIKVTDLKHAYLSEVISESVISVL